jgi:hypothetical protein
VLWDGLKVVKNLSGLLVTPVPVNVILTGVSFVVVAVVGLALGAIAVGNTPRLFYL